MGADDEATINEAGGRQTHTKRITAARYRVGEQIGKGGMGEVLDARDEQIGRDVAIKRMRAPDPNDRAIARFLREARVQGRLDHPAIVPVYELGRDNDGLPFFAMKKLAGTTLAKILDTEELDAKYPRQRLLRAVADVCLAIELAHTRGVIHRDIKPANMILGEFGEVYVLDWGVAKVIDEEDGEFGDVSSGELATMAGAAVGTPGYMSPEQLLGQGTIDGRADVYALGCVLAEVLARPGDGDVPPELKALCERATHDDPRLRIATARELGEHVQRYLDGDRDLALRRKLALEHLDLARAAFAEGDESRATAIQQAGRALALDPTLAGAAELVGRLMIEPPRVMPREVELLIHEDATRTARTNARAAIFGQIGFLAAIPALMLASASYIIPFALLILHNIFVQWRCARGGTIPRPWRIAASNAMVVALVARLFSPFFLAPGVAAVSAMIQAFNPFHKRTRAVVVMAAAFCAAVLVPFAAETAGLLTPTTDMTNGGMVLHAPGLSWSGPIAITMTSIYVIVLIALSVSMGDRMRRSQAEARRRLHLQAWQLSQLASA
ncbi:MAG: Serine/threonine protein kinase PrkC, regulator of stationary phase [Myxococcales bacterium]|nr:Serine/threonine protein kinase PrkC, regulator of stationary phase [Myxococcales bacterium]